MARKSVVCIGLICLPSDHPTKNQPVLQDIVLFVYPWDLMIDPAYLPQEEMRNVLCAIFTSLQAPFFISPLKSPPPSPLSTTNFFPFGRPTSVVPRTLTGIMSYTHLAIRKLPIAQTQNTKARLTVTNKVGTSKRRATPIQKSENSRALMRERRSVPRTKEAKSARGRNEKSN